VLDGILMVHSIEESRCRLKNIIKKLAEALGISMDDIPDSILIIVTKGEHLFDQTCKKGGNKY
jgi:hypothetical protein